jgi:hypothetical protein
MYIAEAEAEAEADTELREERVLAHFRKFSDFVDEDSAIPESFIRELAERVEDEGLVVESPAAFLTNCWLDRLSAEKAAKVATSGFESFWAAYPRKIGKRKAREAFRRAIKSVTPEEILAAVSAQQKSAQWREANGKYIPHPTTWLNRGGWEDEIESNTGQLPSEF